ncbi:MAG: hypothetical protein WCS42_23920, partial [Verrucomicrobiota bacterium]
GGISLEKALLHQFKHSTRNLDLRTYHVISQPSVVSETIHQPPALFRGRYCLFACSLFGTRC